jgi:hypothetical protein
MKLEPVYVANIEERLARLVRNVLLVGVFAHAKFS